MTDFVRFVFWTGFLISSIIGILWLFKTLFGDIGLIVGFTVVVAIALSIFKNKFSDSGDGEVTTIQTTTKKKIKPLWSPGGTGKILSIDEYKKKKDK